MPLLSLRKDAARWMDRVAQATAAAARGLTEIVDRLLLYPAREREREDGLFEEYREILPQQKLVHERIAPSGKRAKFLLHNGGWGSGKSVGLCAVMVELARMYPGIVITIVLPFDYYIDEFVRPTMEEVIPGDSVLIRRATTRSIQFVNGSLIRYKAYADASRVRGWRTHILWVEEGAEVCGGDDAKALLLWYALLGRLRGQGRQYPLLAFVSQNPAGHNWAWRVFVKGNPRGDAGEEVAPGVYIYEKESENGDVYLTIRSGTQANTKLAPGYAGTLRDQLSDSPELVARFLEGSFTPLNMLVYDWPRFSVATHVIRMEDFLRRWKVPYIPPEWPLIVGIDCAGLRSPWAVEFYIECPDRSLVCVGEIYEAGLEWGDLAERVIAWVAESGFEVARYYIDPRSASQRQGENSKTIQQVFTEEYGLPVILPTKYGKMMGVRRVWDLMRRDRAKACPYPTRWDAKRPQKWVADEKDPETGQFRVGSARMYYLQGACPANLAEKEVWKFKPESRETGGDESAVLIPSLPEELEDANDHAQTAEMFATLGWYAWRKGDEWAQRESSPPYTSSRRRG